MLLMFFKKKCFFKKNRDLIHLQKDHAWAEKAQGLDWKQRGQLT